jgi:energy-coupling factor transporter ATP-binding protein EcfA2
MYSQLSASQEQALESNQCPHCHATGTVRKVWTRNGPTVKCDACHKKVYRPRGRAVSNQGGMTTGGQGGRNQSSQGGAASQQGSSSDTNEGKDEQGKQQSSDGNDGSKQLPQNAVNAAQAKFNKPLTEAAKDALAKMEQALTQTMKQQMQEALDKLEREKQQAKQELEEQVSEQVESLRPKEIVVKREEANGQTTQTTIANAHKLLGEVIRRFNAGIRNFLFVGPSGSGKSTLAEQVAEALGVPYGFLPWSGDTTPGTVLGRPSPDGTTFTQSVWLATFYQTASVFNHDELDGADPNVPICMNSAVENGKVYLPTGIVKRHADHIVIATANTWGIGADMLYCGRNQLDAAVRDRFVGGMLFVDYDADLETTLVPEQEYRAAFWEIRQRVFEHKLRRIWGTRTLLRGAKLYRAGYSLSETFKVLTCGFTQDELNKIGV